MKDTPFSGDQLLAKYDRVAGAEDAIPRLRRFVLDLAVRGKLVEQDAGDEPASVLLERIEAEKTRLVKAGEIKRDKTAFTIEATAFNFALPSGWDFATLSQVAACLDYRRKPVNSEEREKRNEGKDESDLFPYFGATQQQGWIDDFLFDGDLVLLGEDGVPFHEPLRTKAYMISGKTWVNNHAHVFQPILVSPKFLTDYLNVFDYTGRVVGATRAKLNQAQALTIPVPVPPLAEQHRIVAKVQELMALLDGLETARGRAEGARDKLTAATLHRLTDEGTDPQTATAFALQAFPALTTRPDQIKPLRQTILNLAVRGKLVPQDPADEPASVLLERIAAEKARLVMAGSARKPRQFLGLNEDDIPCELPSNWAWTHISQLGFVSPRVEASDDTLASFVPMPMVFAEYGTPNRHEKRQWREIKKGYTHFAEGDVGLAKITPCFENGKSTVFRGLTGGIGAGTTELHILRPVLVNPDYVLIHLKSPHFVQTGIPKMTGTAGQKRVPTEYFTSSPFPLPPLAEQHRIVAKVDALMALCDQLETALTTSATTRSRLLDTLIRTALSPDVPMPEAAE